MRSTTQDSPNLQSCTESKGFKVKVIGDGTDESYRRETTSKRIEKKRMARKPKDDPKPLGIHSTDTDNAKEKRSPTNTLRVCSPTRDSPSLQPHSVESVSHQASSRSSKHVVDFPEHLTTTALLLDKNKLNKTAAAQAQTDILDEAIATLKTVKPSLASNTDTLSFCKTTKYRSSTGTTNNQPKPLGQPIIEIAAENVAAVNPKIVAVCSKQPGTKNDNNKSQDDVLVKEKKPNWSDLRKERSPCAAALPINNQLPSVPGDEMPQNGECSLALLSMKLFCPDHNNYMHYHFHVYPPYIRVSKKVNGYFVY